MSGLSAGVGHGVLCRWGVNMSSPDRLPDLQQLICLDDSDHEVVDNFGGAELSFLDQTMIAADFEPLSDGGFTSTQVPVMFSGLCKGAKDTYVEDSEEKRVFFSTENAEPPAESSEEEACFDLVSDSDEGEDIPCSQPRYNIKEMWW